MPILGVLLLWRTLPRLRVHPPQATAYEVSGTANCVTVAHAALVLDGDDPERVAWMLPRKDTQELARKIERRAVCTRDVNRTNGSPHVLSTVHPSTVHAYDYHANFDQIQPTAS